MIVNIQNKKIYVQLDNGKQFEIVPSFERDQKVLEVLDGQSLTKIIKRQSKKTFISQKDGKEKHYYNFYLITSLGKSIQITCKDKDYLPVLDVISEYVK